MNSVKIAFISELKSPAVRSQAHVVRMKRDNQWLSDFMGPDYRVDFEVHDYDTGLACRIMSKDESRWFIGTAPYGIALEYHDRMQEAIDDAVKKAFDAFSQTLPRMDRIMRYGV